MNKIELMDQAMLCLYLEVSVTVMDDVNAKWKACKDIIEKQRVGLAFYGDENNYSQRIPDPFPVGSNLRRDYHEEIRTKSIVDGKDRGQRARDTLALTEKGKREAFMMKLQKNIVLK